MPLIIHSEFVITIFFLNLWTHRHTHTHTHSPDRNLISRVIIFHSRVIESYNSESSQRFKQLKSLNRFVPYKSLDCTYIQIPFLKFTTKIKKINISFPSLSFFHKFVPRGFLKYVKILVREWGRGRYEKKKKLIFY